MVKSVLPSFYSKFTRFQRLKKECVYVSLSFLNLSQNHTYAAAAGNNYITGQNKCGQNTESTRFAKVGYFQAEVAYFQAYMF